ncbi:pyridoxal phosphate-dependent aminotransferase family protein [Lacinutrix sp. Hel_I_90]|uniref:aminotransferase class I/II-fold pyridoxal phosphate-dependent enzyme n=1 Tax=Lacinutrix sp. Hel_I_90 TaxID=1249999 RepID=UPI0005C98E58|nr:pyridoxal phosphate-dependent aminotransferase family protein [Lacinutrix sp. Hel_I_90]
MRSLYLWFVIPKKLKDKLNQREAENALRKLDVQNKLVDFASNDYLGFSKNDAIFNASHNYLLDNNIAENGATGSRLLSGNHQLYNTVEQQLCAFHTSEAALIFNSGYDANLGFFSSVPQRGDIIFYDEYIHASIRDGIKMSNAKAYKFKHNDIADLKSKCQTERSRNVERSANEAEIYIVTESVFSMDGDTPNLKLLLQLCKVNNYHLIVDEAHAVGVFGTHGSGLIQTEKTEAFARIITFGKALGAHGAAILGSDTLKQYLVNFSRPFIYTTGLPPHALATIHQAYETLKKTIEIEKLHQNISFFKSEIERLQLKKKFIESHSAIQCCIIPGNETVKAIAKHYQNKGFDVKAILSPTVPKEKERLRFCLHAYNTKDEISQVLNLLTTFV